MNVTNKNKTQIVSMYQPRIDQSEEGSWIPQIFLKNILYIFERICLAY